MNLPYLLNSLIWAVVGAGGGFFLGRMYRDVNETRERVDAMAEQLDGDDGPAEATAPNRHRRMLHKPSSTQLMGAVIIILALITTVTGWQQSQRFKAAGDCLVQFSTDYSEALRARDADSQRARLDAIDYASDTGGLWRGFLAARGGQSGTPDAGPATPAQLQEMLRALNKFFASNDKYISSLKTVQAQAQRHPIPVSKCRP